MAYTYPTIGEFKTYFDRDFPYGVTNEFVKDSDISKGLDLAFVNFNIELFANQQSFTIGYLLLSAHYLVTNLRASSQGISGQFTWLESSKSVSSVSQSFAIPPDILSNPYISMLMKTTYGAKFIELIYPSLVGQVFTSMGKTTA